MQLPPGLTSRPLRPGDEAAVHAVIVAQELADVGESLVEVADIVADWQRPSFDVGSSTIGVFDGDRLVACAEVGPGGRGDAAVDPSYRHHDLLAGLAAWMRELGRARGEADVNMAVPAGSPAEARLRALGWEERWTSWVLRLPADEQIEPQPSASGYAVREATREEWPAVYDVIETAFGEWPNRTPQSFDDFSAGVFGRPGFEPWNLRVAVDPDGHVVGAAYVHNGDTGAAFVDRLAVRADQRGRGLARALLVDAFGTARRHGGGGAELCTDSRTGALPLYEKVGMRVASSWVVLGARP